LRKLGHVGVLMTGDGSDNSLTVRRQGTEHGADGFVEVGGQNTG
jgi:hypothetical protein